MQNIETVIIGALKPGDVIYRGRFELVIAVTPNAFYPGRCNFQTDKCSILASLTKEVFRVVSAPDADERGLIMWWEKMLYRPASSPAHGPVTLLSDAPMSDACHRCIVPAIGSPLILGGAAGSCEYCGRECPPLGVDPLAPRR